MEESPQVNWKRSWRGAYLRGCLKSSFGDPKASPPRIEILGYRR